MKLRALFFRIHNLLLSEISVGEKFQRRIFHSNFADRRERL